MSTPQIPAGSIIQYRKVGTFEVVAPAADWDEVRLAQWHGNGWYECSPVKAPKKYREQAEAAGGTLRFWIEFEDIVEEA